MNRRVVAFFFGVTVGLPYPLFRDYQTYLQDHGRGLLYGVADIVLIVGLSGYVAFTYIGPRYSE